MYLKLVFKCHSNKLGESENRHKGVTEIRGKFYRRILLLNLLHDLNVYKVCLYVDF